MVYMTHISWDSMVSGNMVANFLLGMERLLSSSYSIRVDYGGCVYVKSVSMWNQFSYGIGFHMEMVSKWNIS